MPTREDLALSEALLARRVLDRAQLDTTLARHWRERAQGGTGTLGEFLVRDGLLTAAELSALQAPAPADAPAPAAAPPGPTASAVRLVDERPRAKGRVWVLHAAATLGRSRRHPIVLQDQSASRDHARLDPAPDGWTVTDLKSRIGTAVNGQRIEKPTLLRPGDRIEIGGEHFRFEGAAGRGSQARLPTTGRGEPALVPVAPAAGPRTDTVTRVVPAHSGPAAPAIACHRCGCTLAPEDVRCDACRIPEA